MELIETTLFSEETLEEEVTKFGPHAIQNQNDHINPNIMEEWGRIKTENFPMETTYNRRQQSVYDSNNSNHFSMHANSDGQISTNGSSYMNRWYEPLEGMMKSNRMYPNDHYENFNNLIAKSTMTRNEGSPSVIKEHGITTPAATSIYSSTSSIKDNLSKRNTSPDVDNNNNNSIYIESTYHYDDSNKMIHTIPHFQPNIQNESDNNSDNSKMRGNRIRTPRKRLTDVQKLAHNKIEKKYRININTKIAQLQKIIPWVSDGETAFEVHSAVKQQNGKVPEEKVKSRTKFNKSLILQKAIDYIVYLRNNEQLYQTEIQRLRKENESLKQKNGFR